MVGILDDLELDYPVVEPLSELDEDDIDSLAEFIVEFFDQDLVEAIIQEVYSDFFDREIESQRELVEQGHYEAAVLRQAAYIESMVTLAVQKELRELKGEHLSDREKNIFRKIGHRNIIYLANILNVLNENQYNAFTELMSKRNKLAHNWWIVTEEDEEDLERVSSRIIDLLEDSQSSND